MIVFEAAVVAGQLNFCDFEDPAAAVAMRGPGCASVLAKKLLGACNGYSGQYIINAVYKRPLVVRNSFGVDRIAGFKNDGAALSKADHGI